MPKKENPLANAESGSLFARGTLLLFDLPNQRADTVIFPGLGDE